jgi:hypothetical protein
MATHYEDQAMGDGSQIQQAGDGKGKPTHDTTKLQLSDAALANITASIYGDTSKQGINGKKAESFPIALADSTTPQVGLQGTYGSPAFPVPDVISTPKQGPIVPASTKPYDFGGSSSSSTDNSQFAPKPYDIDKKVGGDSELNIPDQWGRLVGTTAGAGMAIAKQASTLTKPFKFNMKPFSEAPGVSANTIDKFGEARSPAHKFLGAELTRLQKKAGNLNLLNPDLNTPEQNALKERIDNVYLLKEKTTAELEEGNNPIKKVDFSALTGDTKTQRQFSRITEFQGAQDKLISERAATVDKLGSEARKAYDTEQHTAWKSLGLDVSALVGAQLVDDFVVDKIAPRNRTGWETTVTDFAAPIAVMAMSMSSLGKWAPLAKAGIIVGAHTISHLTFDKQYDEAK